MSGYPNARATAKPAGVERVLVGGVDVTWFRATKAGQTPTRVPGYTLLEPFAYGASETLVIPRTSYYFEQPRTGDLAWFKEEAEVRYERVMPDDSIVTDYVGYIETLCRDGKNWAANVSGWVTGRAALRQKTPPPVRARLDIGHMMHFAAAMVHAPMDPPDGPIIGVKYVNQGGMPLLSWMQQLCALSQTRDQPRCVLMPKVWGQGIWEFRPKDTETVDITIWADGDKSTLDLVADLAERPNTIYGNGIDPDGTRWFNNKYQGFVNAPAPDYPITGGGDITVGMTDADTDSGDGITVLNIHLKWFKLLDPLDPSPADTYSQAMANAVREVKGDAGLPDNGTMNPAAWDAVWDVDVVGYTSAGSRQFPLAQDPAVRPWDFSSTGAIIGKNDDYDPTRVEVDRVIDYGPGIDKQTAIRHARQEVEQSKAGGWAGTITLNASGAFSGERDNTYALAVQLDPDAYADDLIPLQSIRPGMNAWIPQFDDGTLVHISMVAVSAADAVGNRTATLTVDTNGRDAMELSEILARNRESRRNIRREWLIANQGSRPTNNYVACDEWFGELDRNVPLVGGQWNTVAVLMGSSGQVNQVVIDTFDNAAEFCLAVFRKGVTPEQVENLVGDPFPVNSLTGETVWDQDHLASWFDDKRILYSYGTGLQPGGYSWRKHTGADGNPTDAPLTGELRDRTPWPYLTSQRDIPYVTLAIYPDRNCTLRAGKLFYAQVDDVT